MNLNVITRLILLGLVAVLMVGIHSRAEKPSENEPAGEGLTITPAGSLLLDISTRQPAIGALTVDFVRSPDRTGPEGNGRYLIAVNSGYGVQFNSSDNRGYQSLSVIDLNAKPAPLVVQNVYFPSPQSANVGAVFSPTADKDGSYSLYVSGGFENKIWIFRLQPTEKNPLTPATTKLNTPIEAPFIDVTGFTNAAPSARYHDNHAPVYPTGLAISPDGNTLFVANNLGDSLGIVHDLRGSRKLERVDLRRSDNREHNIYPYAVIAWPGVDTSKIAGQPNLVRSRALKLYVSCWNDASIAVIDSTRLNAPVSYIKVGAHPTAMLLNEARNRLFVVNSNDDTVSVIDPSTDKEIERIKVRLAENALPGNTPEGLALSGGTLYVANAHSNSVAVVQLSKQAEGGIYFRDQKEKEEKREVGTERSTVRGFIPTGQYPSALALSGQTLFVGNGKGTGVENSSVVINDSGRTPNAPNDRFPVGTGRGVGQGGQYSLSLVIGNISTVPTPNDPDLARYTQQVLRNNGLIGEKVTRLFPNVSPIKHVIYIIKENRTYDQVFGDVERAGNGDAADGDASLAIFGAGEAARPSGKAIQNITPNHHALALRFGLFDRFFVNSEASPDGHNWSTAAFSSDYVDKAYRWNYSRRGRGYDYEGFNRLPNYEPVRGVPSLFGPAVDADEIANFLREFIPYLHGSRDVAEPETLYLWDAAARAGLTYRNYGEFVATLSEADVNAIKRDRSKSYPDLTRNVSAIPTKKSLEGHYSSTYRNFDLDTPDAMTVESYRAARESGNPTNAVIGNANPDKRFQGVSRFSSWLEEFESFVKEREQGRPDRMPNLSIVRLSNDHTDGVKANRPTPQFFVADNDYAVGKLVEAVSKSAYWKDTAIFVVEDDAQDGADHVDAHRSVGLVISAYNRPGQLIHEFHNTVSMIRTMELLLGLPPMNQLDATAAPMNIFQATPDLRPYSATLPDVALDNLITVPAHDAATAYWMKQTADQDMSHPDMADPVTLNRIIWFSVRGRTAMPAIARLPAFDALRLGLAEDREEIARRE